MNSNVQKSTNIKESLISATMCNELAAIYTATFQYTGMQFVDALLKEITIQTRVQSIVLLQLLTPEEYKEISTKYNKKAEKTKFHIISNTSLSPNSSPEIHHSEEPSPLQLSSSSTTTDSISNNHFQDHFLLIRSCFSNKASIQSRLTNTVIPLSCLNASSPFIKTLLNENKLTRVSNKQTDVEKEEIERGIYPEYEEFVGLRLESIQKEESLIRGILCVTDNTVIDTPRENTIKIILEAVHTRCINELIQLQRQEQLIIARDLAILDAENKLKFLADMSHEIRTPMNAVIALTDLLLQERSTLNMEQIEHLEVIQTSGSHLLTIINDILDISKLNHDPKFKLESRSFSLRKCLKDTLNMARHQASMSQQNKMVYVLECPPDKDDNLPLPQLIHQLENSGVLLRPLLHKKGKTVLPVIWKIDADVPDHLLGDTMRLTQIMLNLCSNAVKFTKQGGIHIRIKRSTPTPLRTSSSQNKPSERRMTFKERYDAKIETMWNQAMQDKRDRSSSIVTSPSNSTPSVPATSSGGLIASMDDMDGMDYFGEKSILEISVTDTGIGIPADRLPRLFKSFSQIDISTARRYGGTGLGLAISSTLVNRMGGCLWVESEEGVGSRFALTLPMTVALRGRNYSSDSTVLGFSGSPSSPSSTVSDSGSSVHSAFGGSNNNAGSDIISPLSSIYNSFTAPVTSNIPSYFPITASQAPPQRPILPRTTHQQLLPSDAFRSEPQMIPQMIQQNNSEQLYSPMAEDAQPLNQSTSAPTNNNIDIQNPEQVKRPMGTKCSSGNNSNNITTGSNRKAYSDLFPPANRNARVAITKQHYHNRKPQNKEENLAKSHPLRILLAEDNILNQKIAISILKRLGYVDVAIANNGGEVLTLMKTSVFDVIFMDLYMPEMDGLEVTREIIKERTRQKQMDMCPSSPNNNNEPTCSTESVTLLNTVDVYIIALTASASREDRQICIDAGMNDFISKPFTMTEMKSALKTCATKRKKRRKLTQKQMTEMEEVLGDNYIEEVSSPIQQAVVVSTNPPAADDPMLDIQSAPTHLV